MGSSKTVEGRRSDASREVCVKEQEAQTCFPVAGEFEVIMLCPKILSHIFFFPNAFNCCWLKFRLGSIHSKCCRNLNLSFCLETKLRQTQRKESVWMCFGSQAWSYSQGYWFLWDLCNVSLHHCLPSLFILLATNFVLARNVLSNEMTHAGHFQGIKVHVFRKF